MAKFCQENLFDMFVDAYVRLPLYPLAEFINIYIPYLNFGIMIA